MQKEYQAMAIQLKRAKPSVNSSSPNETEDARPKSKFVSPQTFRKKRLFGDKSSKLAKTAIATPEQRSTLDTKFGKTTNTHQTSSAPSSHEYQPLPPKSTQSMKSFT